jgi:hypothetical protein
VDVSSRIGLVHPSRDGVLAGGYFFHHPVQLCLENVFALIGVGLREGCQVMASPMTTKQTLVLLPASGNLDTIGIWPTGLVVEEYQEAPLIVLLDEMFDPVTLFLEQAVAELYLIETEGTNRGSSSWTGVSGGS